MTDFSRRALLGAMSAAGVAVVTGCKTMDQPQRTFFDRVRLPIGLQVYTLGPDAGKDIDATFAAIAAIGYREVELPDLMRHTPAQVRAAADRAGVKISSLHVPMQGMGRPGGGSTALSFSGEASAIADAIGALGAQWAVAPICLLPSDFRPLPGENFGQSISRSIAAAGPDLWKRTATLLNDKAQALKPHGVQVGYHNHNLEFGPAGDTTGWAVLMREADPALVGFEVDIGWVAASGQDPVAFLEKAAGRVRLLHVKDVAAGNTPGFAISMAPAEVGSGTLDWARILPAAHKAGVRHFLVEQEPPFTIPRIDAARKSYAYLAQLRA